MKLKKLTPGRHPLNEDGLRQDILSLVSEDSESMNVLAHNPLRELILRGSPGIVFTLMREKINPAPIDPLYRKWEKIVFSQDKLHKLLKTKINKVPQLPAEKLISESDFLFYESLKRMSKVVQFGGNKFMSRVKYEIQDFMKFQKEDGRFPLLYHHHAHACWLLLKMGITGNRLLDKSLNWIKKRQREDGGWLHRLHINKKQDYDSHPSCIWTTAEVLQSFSLRRSFIPKEVAEKGINYLLENALMDNKSKLFSNANTWDKLSIGAGDDSMFYGGTLKVLETAEKFGYHPGNRQFKKLYDWLLGQEMDKGYFPKNADKMPIMDENVTARALILIGKIESSRPNPDNNSVL